MSQLHLQKFDSLMYEYCSNHAERIYKLFEDGDAENGFDYLGHLADVLQLLKEHRSSQELPNITSFCVSVAAFSELEKDAVYTFLQEHGYGQYIPE